MPRGIDIAAPAAAGLLGLAAGGLGGHALTKRQERKRQRESAKALVGFVNYFNKRYPGQVGYNYTSDDKVNAVLLRKKTAFIEGFRYELEKAAFAAPVKATFGRQIGKVTGAAAGKLLEIGKGVVGLSPKKTILAAATPLMDFARVNPLKPLSKAKVGSAEEGFRSELEKAGVSQTWVASKAIGGAVQRGLSRRKAKELYQPLPQMSFGEGLLYAMLSGSKKLRADQRKTIEKLVKVPKK